jgi:putative aminopeptidase FrvX
MSLPPIDEQYLKTSLVTLLNIPGPTGFADAAIAWTEAAVDALNLPHERTRKGALTATLAGRSEDAPRALNGHVDTLGAMVKEIKSNGRLKLTKIGGFAWNTVEGEGCRVFTRSGRVISGSLLLNQASGHVYGQAVNKTLRDDATMEVRLDERTSSAEETRALGIGVGDFVAFDPRVVVTESGFIRSRHLDDKACVAAMLAAVKALQDAGLTPAQRTTLHFSNYEEVGHGAASGFPPDLAELVAVDMAAVGAGQTSDEFHVTICVKDSGGPYHHGLSNRLRDLADQHEIPYKVDIYPYYGSDGEAFWRAGGDVRVALIGPGVDASHNYERTHMDALIGTTQLILAYLLGE